ncbi:MAG: HD domain-containing protein [Clostridia bacterium]|nr:HD domain-containing protein [Clostridia bacterium]
MGKKEEFIELFKKYIKRDGADKLLVWLEGTDFFTCPASTRFHSNYQGGLVDHSVNVYHRYLNLIKNEYGENYEETISDESIAVIALLHDVCKVQTYKTDMRNVKKDGVWVQEPYFTTEEELPYGHGEKSVYIISGFMKLSREEAVAINWHMGGFDLRVKGGSYSIADAYYKFPAAFLIHVADMQATYLDEHIVK